MMNGSINMDSSDKKQTTTAGPDQNIMHRATTRKTFIVGTAAAAAGAAYAGSAFSWYRSPTLAARANADMWKQYSGAKLNFISENTAPSSAAAANMGAFTALTGIDVKITQEQLGNVVEKVALDMGAGTASYQLIYADPYQI